MMNKNIRNRGMLIVATTLLGIGAVIANSDSLVLATPEAKMHLDEGINAIQSGDTETAMTHLKAADELLSAGEAKMHLDEGINAIQSGDTEKAMTHVKAAQSALTG
jgi:cellobiose-specific phosphotransferase system component IIA